MVESEIVVNGEKFPADTDDRAVTHALGDSKSHAARDKSHLPNQDEAKDSPTNGERLDRRIRKLSSTKMFELASSPEFLPKTAAISNIDEVSIFDSNVALQEEAQPGMTNGVGGSNGLYRSSTLQEGESPRTYNGASKALQGGNAHDGTIRSRKETRSSSSQPRMLRTASTPPSSRSIDRTTTQSSHRSRRPTDENGWTPTIEPGRRRTTTSGRLPSPSPSDIPVPTPSLSTYLELELSSEQPSPLFLHRPVGSGLLYEDYKTKVERLQNFLLLPIYLEPTLWFGALACMDAWLYSFTILPLRFIKATWILSQPLVQKALEESQFIANFNYRGIARLWRRRGLDRVRSRSASSDGVLKTRVEDDRHPSRTLRKFSGMKASEQTNGHTVKPSPSASAQQQSHTPSSSSSLLPGHKADIVNFLLILLSCVILSRFDASRMYHSIRGQAAIKLYVLYNVLEVCDRLFGAIGQDILECLLSKETLEQGPDGQISLWRPMWLFGLALFYNLVHAMALFYQVITLNVAVNSYSNALLTLLMSNQFVEIKSTVFKKFEKDNLFQLTCADIVERFQLWLMLTIIAARNLIETGGLSLPHSDDLSSGAAASSTILPFSFTLLSNYSIKVLTPFLVVLGSETLVDNLKHAYVTKFNNTRPAIYGRYLDLLAKDYYTNAFDQNQRNLTFRLGLPIVPLACLGIRAAVQTYRMFLAIHLPPPAPNPSTSLVASPEPSPSPSTLATILRLTLGHSAFGSASASPDTPGVLSLAYWTSFTSDDVISLATMVAVFIVFFCLLLVLKLLLGMTLLEYARHRYKGMKEREAIDLNAKGKRLGGWGVVEMSDEKRRWIYRGEEDEWKARGKDAAKATNNSVQGEHYKAEGSTEAHIRTQSKTKDDWSHVRRYDMVAKRIW